MWSLGRSSQKWGYPVKPVVKKSKAQVGKNAPSAKLVVPVAKKSDLTRQRVLKITAALFRRKGYQATSMRDIAAAVGMKSGSLYYYYESKEALLAAILNENIESNVSTLRKVVSALPEGATVRDKFRVAIEASIKLVAEAGDMALASAQTLSQLQEPDFSEQVRHRRAYNQFWRDLITEGKQTGEIDKSVPDAIASMVIAGALAFVGEWYQKKLSTTKEVGEIFLRMFFDGMRSTDPK